jgi:hypothetical protein
METTQIVQILLLTGKHLFCQEREGPFNFEVGQTYRKDGEFLGDLRKEVRDGKSTPM